jgi:hypothetical protein
VPLFALLFPSPENGTPFHNKKPGAVTRPGICVTVTDICSYMNFVTFVNTDDAGPMPDRMMLFGAGKGAYIDPAPRPHSYRTMPLEPLPLSFES